MAEDEHASLLMKGVEAWNAWRDANRQINPDLSDLDLNGADLSGYDLSWTNLSEASLEQADLKRANFNWADLGRANLTGADLRGADLLEAYLGGAILIDASLVCARLERVRLLGANLTSADLRGADLTATLLGGADFCGADLSGADLRGAMLVNTKLTGAKLNGCRVYAVSVWDVDLDGAEQQNLVITTDEESEITVDNIEIAQFLYLLLRNQKLRDVIDTITAKAVLIMGSFAYERKVVLHALREELRLRGYLPILFDFEKPHSRDTDETITLLARMARFIIADISDARSVLQELRAIVPDLPSVPVQPIIMAAQVEPGMFDFYRNRPSFLVVHRYENQAQLLTDIGEMVIRPAEQKVLELRG